MKALVVHTQLGSFPDDVLPLEWNTVPKEREWTFLYIYNSNTWCILRRDSRTQKCFQTICLLLTVSTWKAVSSPLYENCKYGRIRDSNGLLGDLRKNIKATMKLKKKKVDWVQFNSQNVPLLKMIVKMSKNIH